MLVNSYIAYIYLFLITTHEAVSQYKYIHRIPGWIIRVWVCML